MLIWRLEFERRIEIRLLALPKHMGSDQFVHVLSLLPLMLSILKTTHLYILVNEILELEFLLLAENTIVSYGSSELLARICLPSHILMYHVFVHFLLTQQLRREMCTFDKVIVPLTPEIMRLPEPIVLGLSHTCFSVFYRLLVIAGP